MDINYFDLSGGICQSSTKTELGLSSKLLYWADSKNVEIYNNKGIVKQKGNTLLLSLPEQSSVMAMSEMESDGLYKLIIATEDGKIYVYSESTGILKLLDTTITGKKVQFVNFLRGVIVSTDSDEMFYIKDNSNFDVVKCNLKDKAGNVFYPDCVTVYKGRVWCSNKSTIYYSALGTYNDFKTENDAGYISDFLTDTADITAIHTYKDYLAIYKKERVYLLSGSNPSDFSVMLFADKGTIAKNSIVNVDNKQFFLSNGIFALEQVGELNQIRLGSEISQNIKNEFSYFDTARLKYSNVLHYENKNQTWYFFPYLGNEYYNTIWINDYVNHAWYKREIPQKITTACNFHSYILIADNEGNIYYEDYGTTFNGESISFMWKSPFLSLGNVHHRKLIEEFYFVLDDELDNKFQCSVYKDYDGNFADDYEQIISRHFNQLVWATSTSNDSDCWANVDENVPIWTIGTDVLEKAEICGSCYAVQICVEGSQLDDNCAIIGLQFREIYNDD